MSAVGGHAYANVEPHPGADLVTDRRRWWPSAEEERVADAAASGKLAARRAHRRRGPRHRGMAAAMGERGRRSRLPHELDWLRTAVHLEKGCYRGQETVAKVHNLGHPPRRIVALQLDGSDSVLPGRGDEVFAGENVVGIVTSAALHFEEGPIALAVVRRTPRSMRGSSYDLGRRDRRGTGGHRPSRGGSDRQHPATAPARSRAGEARPWATRRSRRRRRSRPAGGGAWIRVEGCRRVRHSRSRSCRSSSRRRAPTRSRTTCWGILRRCWPRRCASRASGWSATPDRDVCSRRSRDAGGNPRRRAQLLVAGSGWWQLALALALTLVVARFLSAQASFAIAAASRR